MCEDDAVDGRSVVCYTNSVRLRSVLDIMVGDHVAKTSRHDAEHGQKDAVGQPLLNATIREMSDDHRSDNCVNGLCDR